MQPSIKQTRKTNHNQQEMMACDEPDPHDDVDNNNNTDTMTPDTDEEDAPPPKLPCTEEYMATAERLLQRDSIHKDSDGDGATKEGGEGRGQQGSDTSVEKGDTDAGNDATAATASSSSSSSADITPGMVEQLYREIDRLDDKPTYDLANKGLKSKYIHRREMTDKFLRAERYRPDRAADRLNCFLDTALEYWGPQGLIRPVRISDLTRIERDLLKSGRFQVLAGRTRPGRRVAFNYAMACTKGVTGANVARVVFYFLQTLSNDEITQRRGLEVVELVPLNFSLRTLVNDSHVRKEVFKVTASMPIRISTIHVCLPPIPSSRAMKAILSRTNGALFRQHVRFHVGTPSEIQKILDKQYDLPHDLLPFMYDGKMKLKTHNRWVNVRMTLDDMQQRDPNAFDKAVRSGSIIECPNNTDVCGGKGQAIQSSPGNVAMRHLLEETIDEYNGAESRSEKSSIIARIVQEIQGTREGTRPREPGKFLNQHPSGLWYVKMTEKESLAKVSMAFRDVRKKIAAERRLESRRQVKDIEPETLSAISEQKSIDPVPSPTDAVTETSSAPQPWPSLKRADESHLPPRKRSRSDAD